MKHITLLDNQNRVLKKISILLLLLAIANVIYAQRPVVEHNINTGGTLTISGGKSNGNDYYVRGTGTKTANRILVQTGYEGTITLDNVMIQVASGNLAAIRVYGTNGGNVLSPDTKVTFILKGYNQLESGAGNSTNPKTATPTTTSIAAALQVDVAAQIHIRAFDENDDESGELVARSYHGSDGGAGIGGPCSQTPGDGGSQGTVLTYGILNQTTGVVTNVNGNMNISGGNIIISSGTIFARGGRCGAGIGSGYQTIFSGNIIIYGGDVTAYGGDHSAGIGTGCPSGSGNDGKFCYTSSIIVLPPAKISATTEQKNVKGLAGANSITYVGDPESPLVTVRTEDNEPYADIYADITETTSVVNVFDALKITSDMCDLTSIKFGTTDASGLMQFRATLAQNVTFFTDASSSKEATFGRPYKPSTTTVLQAKTIVLPLLDIKMSFEPTDALPLEVGYNEVDALTNSYMLKVIYSDGKPMSAVEFDLQSGTSSDFTGLKFYNSEGVELGSAPASLSNGNAFYVRIPIKQGKEMGIYNDVLRISGIWDGASTGYIRQVITQRVVYDDTQGNEYIQVTASKKNFTVMHPTDESLTLYLNINHKDVEVGYNASDVTARYIITTKEKYDEALAETPLTGWTNMTIPATESTLTGTTVSFTGKAAGIYYIHWYVTSGVIYAHSKDVTEPAGNFGGFGKYIIYPPIVAGTLKGNPFVCSGGTPIEIKGDASSGGSGNFTYQWQISTNNSTWTNIPSINTQNYTPAPITTSPTYFRRVTKDNTYSGVQGETGSFTISIVTAGTTLYWNRSAVNNNWNDPTNWTNASGVVQNQLPVPCTNVYIPSGITNYPSLHPDYTPTDVYGLPVCENITFAYGSELIYQHVLTYEKAFIQYNFGYYDSTTGGIIKNSDTANSPVMLNRNTWYALAAPLKKMASGDFALGGYPFSWQANYEVASSGEDLPTIQAKAYASNDVDLQVKTYNAIGVKMAGYTNGITGYKDQKNLEGLKGILEIPYFENNTVSQFRPGHSYDKYTKSSNFYYYNSTTLQPIHSPVGTMKRADEAYRFVYENETTGKPDNINVGGNVPGYAIKVKAPAGSGNKVLIGNPFLAAINAQKFWDANSGALLPGSQYLVFKASTGTWENMSYTASNNINSFQAFIVTLIDANEYTLYFPLEGTYALTGVGQNGTVPTRAEMAIEVQLTDMQGNGEKAMLASGTGTTITNNVEKFVSATEEAVPEVFFVDMENKSYNLIQLYNNEIAELGIGVKASETGKPLTLSFANIQDFVLNNSLRQLVLIDNSTGNTVDLTHSNSYTFTHKGTSTNGYYVDTNRFVLKFADTGINNTDTGSIYYIDNTIYAEGLDVNYVTVFDISGNKLYELTQSEMSYVPLSAGVYIVKVVTRDGTTKSARIMVK